MSEPLFKNILVPVDLGDTSIAPLHYAGLFARQFGSGVTLMYADELATLFSEFDPEFIARRVRPPVQPEGDENAVRTFAAHHLAGVAPQSILVVPGNPTASIVQVAKDKHADLIIMGTHGRRGWRRALAGSVAEGVVRGASQPVLVVPATRDGRLLPEKITRVVCPVNFTDAAEGALEYACSVATAFQAELLLVHVHESDSVDLQAMRDNLRACVPASLSRRCTFSEVVLRGGPAERVLDCVEDVRADLLVMGAQLSWLRTESVIGTTAERLLRFSPIPVLTVTRKAVASERHDRAEELLRTIV